MGKFTHPMFGHHLKFHKILSYLLVKLIKNKNKVFNKISNL